MVSKYEWNMYQKQRNSSHENELITKENLEVLNNISDLNNIEVKDIIGLLTNEYLYDLVKKNDWECDYSLENGSPWVKETLYERD